MMCSATSFLLLVTFCGTVSCLWYPWPGKKECVAPSLNKDGVTPAFCGGFAGAKCPSKTDTCTFFPGSDFGPCCVGCGRFAPPPSVACYRDWDCRLGERCVKPVNNWWAKGACCLW